jgi:hypothetical protein
VTVRGAAALLLATSIGEVADTTGLRWLTWDDEVSLAVRAEVLSRVLGVDRNDGGVLLAAGWPDFPAPDEIAPPVDQDGLRTIGAAVASHAVPDGDRDWLGGGPDALVRLADTVGRTFTSRLVGFHATPYDYLISRLFGPSGVVTIDDVSITVELDAPPLLVVLQLAGLADFVTTLPWRPETLIVRHEGRA